MTKYLFIQLGLISIFVAGITTTGFAQKKTIEDVLSISLRNSGEIMQDNDVSGYYFFYETAKVSRKERKYVVNLVDQNLEPIGKKTFTGTRYLSLREGTYNGDNLALRLVDPKEEKTTIRLINSAGESVANKTFEYGPYDAIETQQSLKSRPLQRLFGIPGRGFAYYSLAPRKGKMSQTDYTISFISNTKGEKGWVAKSRASSENYEAASFIAASEDILISMVVKREKMMSRDFEYFVMATDINTGDKLFEKKIEDRKYAMSITKAWVDGDDIHFFGEFYAKDEKTSKAKSLGICSFTSNKSGEFSSRKYLKWNSDISALLPSSERGKIKDIGYMFFHDFIPTADGKVIAVAETYSKDISAGGLALKALGGGTSAFQITVGNLYFFTFSSDFDLENVEIIEKTRNNVLLGEGYGLLNVKTLGYIVKGDGGFDYAFTQKTDDGFSVGYVDYERKRKEKNGFIYGSINYYDDTISVEKVTIDSDADEFHVFRSKPGYVFIMEYYRRERRLSTRLEKVN